MLAFPAQTKVFRTIQMRFSLYAELTLFNNPKQ